MTAEQTSRRGEAWELGLAGEYEEALEILDDILRANPPDFATLRLKGNLLELKAMALLENSGKSLQTSADYVAARDCYETILKHNPQDIAAHIDLGDHFRNLSANDKALEHYKDAARCLEFATDVATRTQDLQQLLEGVSLLTKHDRVRKAATELESWCKEEALRAVDERR